MLLKRSVKHESKNQTTSKSTAQATARKRMAYWYTTEIKILKQMYLDGYGPKRIAEKLGTTKSRVDNKVTELGLRKMWRNGAPKRRYSGVVK